MRSDQRKAAVSFLKECLPDLRAVYLFGSRAAGQEKLVHEESDYDIAFRQNPGQTISGYERLQLASALGSAARIGDVDLVDISASGNHELKLSVLDGELLWAADEDEADEWMIKTATMANDWLLSERELREEKIAEFRAYAKGNDTKKS